MEGVYSSLQEPLDTPLGQVRDELKYFSVTVSGADPGLEMYLSTLV